MGPALPILLQATDHSWYQDAKVAFLSLVPVPKFVVHVAIGLLVLWLAVTLLRRPLGSWTALIPGLVLSLVMEAFDLYDDKTMINRFRWDESLKDLVVTNLLPFAIVWYERRVGGRDRSGADGAGDRIREGVE